MEHSFDVDIAQKYGIPSAVLLKNLYFWIEKNRANGTNYNDGYYWTYNSKKAFTLLFPYMTARQIETALKKLIDDEVITTGNYNKSAYDRTLWYAITKKGYSILQKCEMEETKNVNGNNENVEPIPYINTGSKQIKNKDIKKASNTTYDEILSTVENEELRELYKDYIKMRAMIKAPMTDRALTMLISKVNELEPTDTGRQKKLLETAIMNNWKSVYPLKDETGYKKASGSDDGKWCKTENEIDLPY